MYAYYTKIVRQQDNTEQNKYKIVSKVSFRFPATIIFGVIQNLLSFQLN